jgi:hypothetical protein
MKSVKKIVSILMITALVISSVPFAMVSSSALSASADASLVLNRPAASIVVTDVTRVAYAANSMKQPSGTNSVIVSATPSGIPYTTGKYIGLAYGGETPSYSQISFTPGVTLSGNPTISCNNTTVTMSNYVYSNGTYVWQVTGGTATVGTTLLFTVSYSFSEVNSTTGKTYTHTFQTQGTSYVEAIASPAGMFSTKRTYEDFGLGTSTKNRSYIGSYILGVNTYGGVYSSGTGDGSVDFTGTTSWSSAAGWTSDYGIMKNFSGSNASRNYNVAYGADSNRPISYIYLDKSIHSTLSDINLRLQTVLPAESDESDERVTVSVNGIYVQSGVKQTFSSATSSDAPANETSTATQLGLTSYSGSIKGAGTNFLMYFSGVGPSTSNSTTDYTVAVNYNTSASWSGVYVGQSFSLEVATYDKGALRTLVEDVQNTDPTVMTVTLPSGERKGYNPQSWYYSSGWEAFLNAFNAAKSCLDKPNVTQSQIDACYTTLSTAYDNLTLQTADYSLATAYYNQAMNKVEANYTLASWAKLKTAIDNYKTGYSILYQPAVDKMAIDIKTAMDNLVEANADYSQLLVQLTNVNRIMTNAPILYGVEASAAYTNWSTLVSVLNNAGCAYNTTDGYVVGTYLPKSQQSTVDGYVLLLTNAVNGLTLVGANYTAAVKAESAYKLLNVSYIKDDIASNLTTAYNNLVALHGLNISRQSDIDAAVTTLNYWLNNIEYKPANTAAATALIAQANALDRSLYTDFTGVDTAVANLQAKLGLDIRYQSDIDRYTSALKSAIDKLTANSADYTAVDAAITAAEDIANDIADTYASTYGFTAATFYSNWSDVQTAINNVVRGLGVTQQSTVDAYAAAINTAVGNLTENKADYSKVTALQTQAYNIVSTGDGLYTSESLDNLTTAYINVITNLKISKQSTVDGYATAIQNAINNLVYLNADYSAVNTQKTAAQAKISTNDTYKAAHPGYSYYTDDSVSALNLAIASVVTGLDIRYQTQVDGYATAIQDAISALVLSGADYTKVDIALSQVPSDTSKYTSLSVATLNATVNSINRSLKADKQSTVDKYVTSINNAIANLKYKDADYTAVNTAKAKVPTDSSLYTSDSWAYLQSKISAVVYGLDITHQEEVNTYASAINEAINILKYKTADYTQVTAALANVPADLTPYTDTSVTALNSAVNAVVYDLDVTKQSTVDGYASAILTAISGLAYKSGDYSAVKTAKGNVPSDSSLYTDVSWANLQTAVNAVVYDLDITHQTEIDAYAAAINSAIAALVYKDANYTDFNTAKTRLEGLKSFNLDKYNEIKFTADSIADGLNITHQAEIDAATLSINNALDAVPADYTAVESAKSAAQTKIATGYYTDASVAALQTKIDAVVYNLNFEHQNEVNTYASDIVNATNDLVLKLANYTELQKILDLLDNSSSEIYNITYSNFDEVMALITAYRTNTVAPNMNLTIDKQSQVDEMTSTLQGYIDSLQVKVAFEVKSGSTTVINGNYIYGLQTKLTKSMFEQNYVSLTNVTVAYSNPNSARYLGTGTTVTVTSNVTNQVIATYTIVIFGDINGDGLITTTDRFVLGDSLSGNTDVLQGVFAKAAKISGNKKVTLADKSALSDVLSGQSEINQVTGIVG